MCGVGGLLGCSGVRQIDGNDPPHPDVRAGRVVLGAAIGAARRAQALFARAFTIETASRRDATATARLMLSSSGRDRCLDSVGGFGQRSRAGLGEEAVHDLGSVDRLRQEHREVVVGHRLVAVLVSIVETVLDQVRQGEERAGLPGGLGGLGHRSLPQFSGAGSRVAS
jgi:hypothetical protein